MMSLNLPDGSLDALDRHLGDRRYAIRTNAAYAARCDMADEIDAIMDGLRALMPRARAAQRHAVACGRADCGQHVVWAIEEAMATMTDRRPDTEIDMDRDVIGRDGW